MARWVNLRRHGAGDGPLERFTSEDWREINPAGSSGDGFFGTGWANATGTYAGSPAAFAMDPWGMVRFTGIITRDTAHGLPDTIWRLPAGYWPEFNVSFACFGTKSSTRTWIQIVVQSDGQVVERNFGLGPSPSGTFEVGLEPIKYRVLEGNRGTLRRN